jgi:hypothetical protein
MRERLLVGQDGIVLACGAGSVVYALTRVRGGGSCGDEWRLCVCESCARACSWHPPRSCLDNAHSSQPRRQRRGFSAHRVGRRVSPCDCGCGGSGEPTPACGCRRSASCTAWCVHCGAARWAARSSSAWCVSASLLGGGAGAGGGGVPSGAPLLGYALGTPRGEGATIADTPGRIPRGLPAPADAPRGTQQCVCVLRVVLGPAAGLCWRVQRLSPEHGRTRLCRAWGS